MIVHSLFVSEEISPSPVSQKGDWLIDGTYYAGAFFAASIHVTNTDIINFLVGQCQKTRRLLHQQCITQRAKHAKPMVVRLGASFVSGGKSDGQSADRITFGTVWSAERHLTLAKSSGSQVSEY